MINRRRFVQSAAGVLIPVAALSLPRVARPVVFLQDTGGGAAYTGPVLETWTANDSGGATVTSLTLTKPSGVATDDLLIMLCGSDDSGASSDPWATHSGWNQAIQFGDGNSDVKLSMYWRIADGAEGASESVSHSTSDELMGWYMRITGAPSSSPFANTGVATTEQNTASSSSVTVGALTAITDEQILCLGGCFFDGGDGDPFTTSETGYTIVDSHDSGNTGNDVSGAIFTRDITTETRTPDAGHLFITASVSDGSVGWQCTIKSA